jgi:hypothetical protein
MDFGAVNAACAATAKKLMCIISSHAHWVGPTIRVTSSRCATAAMQRTIQTSK